MSVLVVSGTGTGIGKTIVTAALAAVWRAAGRNVSVVKPAQTGASTGDEPDLDVVGRLSGVTDLHELARFAAPLSPEAAARVSGREPLDLSSAAGYIKDLADRSVLVEGAGGLLVRYDPSGTTIADLAAILDAPVLLVTAAGLGTLNHTAATLEALRTRGLRCAGVVIGSWPREPGLAERENLTDLRVVTGGPLAGMLPEGAGALPPERFAEVARAGLAPGFGGTFSGG